MTKFKTTIFIDSNVVLEARPLADLPWNEIDVEGPILILVTPTLLKEVDAKKQHGRLAARARQFNRLVTPLALTGKPIRVATGAVEVYLGIAECRTIDWSIYDDLDRNEGDCRIIAEILNSIMVDGNEKILVSQDLNPLFMAKRHGIQTRHVSEHWLPKPEPSPHEKELGKLQRLVRDYEKSEPEFDIEITIFDEPAPLYRVKEMDSQSVDETVAEILRLNPKPIQDSGGHVLNAMQFDSTLGRRYKKYEEKFLPEWVKSFNSNLELLFNQFPVRFRVENFGKFKAEHLNIEIIISGGWLNSKLIVPSFNARAPEIKNPIFSNLSHLQIPSRAEISALGRHEVDFVPPKKIQALNLECENFRQGQVWEFDGSLWLDPRYDRPAVITISVTAGNLHRKFDKHLKVEKKISECEVVDLIKSPYRDFSKPYPFGKKFEYFIAEEKYDGFEIATIMSED